MFGAALMKSKHWTDLPKRVRTFEEMELFLYCCTTVAALTVVSENCADLSMLIESDDLKDCNALHHAAHDNRPTAYICKLVKLGVNCRAKPCAGSVNPHPARNGRMIDDRMMKRRLLKNSVVNHSVKFRSHYFVSVVNSMLWRLKLTHWMNFKCVCFKNRS